MKKIILLLSIISILPLFAQEKEVISSESKKWGVTLGVYSYTRLTPALNIFYRLNDTLGITLSIRKRDLRRDNALADGSAFIYSYRPDTWIDSYSSRNAIAPGIEWFPRKSNIYITGRLGYEVYTYKSHNDSFYHEAEKGYTRYRSFDVKTNRERIFGELGVGFRTIYWERLIIGWEFGGRKIFSSQYKSNSYNDLNFYRNNSSAMNYPTTYNEEKIKTFGFYFSLSLGIAF